MLISMGTRSVTYITSFMFNSAFIDKGEGHHDQEYDFVKATLLKKEHKK